MWNDEGQKTENLRVSTQEVKQALDEGRRVVLLDVRAPEPWASSSNQAADAVRMPIADFEAHAVDLPRDAEIVAYCTCPHEASSTRGAQRLHDPGYEHAHALLGGYQA
jgi:rhodanese-related sulfurtransferase